MITGLRLRLKREPMKFALSTFFLLLSLLAGCQPADERNINQPFYTTEVPPTVSLLYVAPDGNDKNPGTQGEPLATVAEAVRRLEKGGGVIRLAPGVYCEQVRLSIQATETAPLVIEGARTSSGDWLSILSGEERLDRSLWAARPDLGAGVYAYPRGEARLMLINGKSVARLDAKALAREEDGGSSKPRTVHEVLAWPEDHALPQPTGSIAFWDAIGGVYTSSADDRELYLRLAGGMNPAEQEVGIAREGATVTLASSRYVILRNLLIRGGQHGVDLLGERTNHNRVESCYIPHGQRRIYLGEGASDNVIAGNRLEMGFIGQPTGAWTIGENQLESAESTAAGQKRFIYLFFKYWASPVQTSDDASIHIETKTGVTRIENNLLDGGLTGIRLRGNAVASGNVVRRMSSVGTSAGPGAQRVIWKGNLFSDCNINIRFQSMNQGEARELRFLNNVSIQPDGRGQHLFCHYFGETPQTPAHRMVIAQNTFLGGHFGLTLPRMQQAAQGIPGFLVMNNRFIGIDRLLRASREVLGNRLMFGAFDYNQIVARQIVGPTAAVWMGGHNLVSESAAGWQWTELDYTAPADDPAAGKGFDTTQPYRFDGKVFPPPAATTESDLSRVDPEVTPGAPKLDFTPVLLHRPPELVRF